MELNTELLEGLVEKDEYSRRVVRVLSWEQEPGAQKGDNYLSEVTRVRMKVLLGSGLTTTKSVIMKHNPTANFSAKVINQFSPFATEIMMYRDVLPQMEILLKEVGSGEEPFWPHCIGYRPNDQIYFSDLRELGYTMANREGALDFNHAELALRSLGKFHALSLVLLDRQIIIPHYFMRPLPVNRKLEISNKIIDNCLSTLASVMKHNWGQEWTDKAHRIEKLRLNLDSIKDQLWEADLKSSALKVLIHGDCWTNNVMYKYKEGTKIPMSMKFVDFQMGCHTTYAYDLGCFLYMSLQPEVRWTRLDELLAIYQSSLESMMSRLGLEEAPTLDEIKEEMKSHWLVNFVYGCLMFPLASTPGKVDMDKYMGSNEQAQEDKNRFLVPRIVNFLQKDIKLFMEQGVL